MLKKFGIAGVVLAALLLLGTVKPAKAEVHFGVYLGAPAYPVYPVRPYVNSYVYPYTNPYVYPYVYSAPRYIGPSFGFSWRDRDHDRRDWRDHGRDRHDSHGNAEHRGRR